MDIWNIVELMLHQLLPGAQSTWHSSDGREPVVAPTSWRNAVGYAVGFQPSSVDQLEWDSTTCELLNPEWMD